jgi:hypothetical protein
MRLAIVTDAWAPQINGAVTTLKRTCVLEARGHAVTVVSPDQYPTIRCPTYPEIRLALMARAARRATLDRSRWRRRGRASPCLTAPVLSCGAMRRETAPRWCTFSAAQPANARKLAPRRVGTQLAK